MHDIHITVRCGVLSNFIISHPVRKNSSVVQAHHSSSCTPTTTLSASFVSLIFSLFLVSRSDALYKATHSTFIPHLHNAHLRICRNIASGYVKPPRVSTELFSRCYRDGNSGTDQSTPTYLGDGYQPDLDGPLVVCELRGCEYVSNFGENVVLMYLLS